MALASGVRLGPYQIVALLGAGAMGEVYRARDDRLNRDVAIKVLPSWAAADPDMLRRFETEARAAGGLNHPGIVSIHDVGRNEFGPYIVSELLEGETLRGRLRHGPLAPGEALDLGYQLVAALAAAHEHGIVHRDLKPENLFVTSDGRLKILDFGIARLAPHLAPESMTAAEGVAGTTPGVVLGTYGYMSPEQANGLAADHRSDIFSVGAVLYEMVSGRRAFPGRSHIEIANAVIRQTPPPLVEAEPGLRQVIDQCLEKDPAKRYQSAREVVAAIKALRTAGGTHVTVAATAAGPRGWGRSAIVAGAVVAVLAAGGTAVGRWLLARPASTSPIRSLAVLPSPSYSESPADAYFADSMIEAMIADLTRISSVNVTSRTSVMRYRGSDKTARQIASELGVEGLIETSIFKTGNHVRLTAKLLDARTDGRILWSQVFEREMEDVLTLQSEVARAVSKEISAVLTPAERAYLDEARRVDPAAHEAYLRGQYALNRLTETSLHDAIRYFEDAIKRDPGFARAYVGLSNAYSWLRSIYVPPESVMPKAKAAALKAVELDPAFGEGHVALGAVLMYYDWDWPAAEEELKRAIGLNRNLAEAHHLYAMLLAVMGHADQAMAEADRALLLDPASAMLRADAAWTYYLLRRYDLVVVQSKKATELEPELWLGHMMLGLGYEKLERYDLALQALQKARSLDDGTSILEMLGGLYATMGKPAEARKVLAELDEQATRRYVCPYEVATIHATLGDRKSTLAWLEKGRRDRADCMPWMAVDPKLDTLQNDPGFQDLVRRAGIQPPNRPARR